jgi:hypothetical protein
MRARLLTGIGIMLLVATGLTRLTLAQSPATCPDTLASRLTPGGTGQVSGAAAHAVYAELSADSSVSGEMQAGEAFYVYSGPACAEGFAWYYVTSVSGLTGWTVEAVDDAYALEPLIVVPAAPEAVLFEAGAISFSGIDLTVGAALASSVQGVVVAYEDPQLSAILPVGIGFYLITDGDQTDDARSVVISPALAVELAEPGAISAFQQTLAERSAAQPLLDSALSDYTFFGAEALIDERGQYVDFQNGAGWRSLQVADQELATLDFADPYTFSYVFIGLSSDSRYLVQAQIPITIALDLDYPATGSDDISAFLPTLAQALADAPPEAFTPALEDIDAMIASLSIAPDALPAEVFSALETTAAWDEASVATAETPVPASTPAPSDCLLRAVDGRVRIYDEPDTGSSWTGFLFEDSTYYAVELVDNDGLTWYKLADESVLNESLTEFPGWVSDDRVNVSGACNIPGQ